MAMHCGSHSHTLLHSAGTLPAGCLWYLYFIVFPVAKVTNFPCQWSIKWFHFFFLFFFFWKMKKITLPLAETTATCSCLTCPCFLQEELLGGSRCKAWPQPATPSTLQAWCQNYAAQRAKNAHGCLKVEAPQGPAAECPGDLRKETNKINHQVISKRTQITASSMQESKLWL